MLGYMKKVLLGVTNSTGEKFGNSHSNKRLSFKIGSIRYYPTKKKGLWGGLGESIICACIYLM